MSKKASFYLRYTLLYGLCCAISIGLGFVLVTVLLAGEYIYNAWVSAGIIIGLSLVFGFALATSVYRVTQRRLRESNGEKK